MRKEMYSAVVETYSRTIELPKKSIMQSLELAGIGFFLFASSWLVYRHFGSPFQEQLHVQIAGAFVAAAGWVVCDFFIRRSKRRDCTITIHNDLIMSRTRGALRKIYRYEIKSVREVTSSLWNDSGLLISKRGAMSIFLFGGVFIPANLPEFEMIKRFIEGPEEAELELPAQ